MMLRTLTASAAALILAILATTFGVAPQGPSPTFAATSRATPAEPTHNRPTPATRNRPTPVEPINGARRPKQAKAKAKPADHCIPKSACRCQWENLDGKKQYVCRVIRATPR